MEDRRDIRVTNTRRRPGFAEKTKPCRFINEISFTDDFQSHWAVQIDVERLVGDAHRTPTQFERFPVFTRHQLVVVKSLRWLLRHRLECIPRRRLAGLNPVSKSLAKHADRTEFHCSRKLIAATRAGALGLRAHGPNRPPIAISASQNAWISSLISTGECPRRRANM